MGGLPPPTLLRSVPLVVSTAGNSGATVVSLPAAGVTVSPSTGTVSHAAEASLPNTTVPPAESSVTAVSLSPAAEPFPMKLVEKIRSGRFVEMRELLTDNVSLLQQLDTPVCSAYPPRSDETSPAGGDHISLMDVLFPGVHGTEIIRPGHNRQAGLCPAGDP